MAQSARVVWFFLEKAKKRVKFREDDSATLHKRNGRGRWRRGTREDSGFVYQQTAQNTRIFFDGFVKIGACVFAFPRYNRACSKRLSRVKGDDFDVPVFSEKGP